MNAEDYLQDRLGDQLEWYDRKSQICQKWFKGLTLAESTAASLILFLTGMGGEIPGSAWIIGGLSVIIAVASTASAINKFQENWIQYRTTAECLKHEKYLYLTHSAPYRGEDKLPLLVARVERLISKENSDWSRQALGDEDREQGSSSTTPAKPLVAAPAAA